jgi:hypothetical protein
MFCNDTAAGPIFCFLVFNILLRSSNRRISMIRMAKDSFRKLEQVYGSLTADRLKAAEDEMRGTRTTTYHSSGTIHLWPCAATLKRNTTADAEEDTKPQQHQQPDKDEALHPQLNDYDTAKELLTDLRGRFDSIVLSTMEPVSSAPISERDRPDYRTRR